MRLFKKHLSADSIVCCSGGVDSICAAHILQKRFGVTELYHFNHGTPQASTMQKKVEHFARVFGFNLTIWKADEPLLREADFRNARFKYINSQHNKVFVMAHNLDEATESYTQNFLIGHPEYWPIPVVSEFGSNKVIHPFLMIDKHDFREYANRHKLNYFIEEDKSNYDPRSSRRSWIRHELLPQLKEFGLKKIVKKKYLELTKL